jgi:hypothetical protein
MKDNGMHGVCSIYEGDERLPKIITQTLKEREYFRDLDAEQNIL